MVTLQQPEGRSGCEGSSALRGRLVGGRLECALQPYSPLGKVAAHVPEAAERHGQRELLLHGARGLEVVERRPQIVVLGLEEVEPLGLLILAQVGLGLGREREAPFRETGTGPVGVRGVSDEQLGCVFVDRFEQPEPRSALRERAPDEVMIDQRGEHVEAGFADRFRGLDGRTRP